MDGLCQKWYSYHVDKGHSIQMFGSNLIPILDGSRPRYPTFKIKSNQIKK